MRTLKIVSESVEPRLPEPPVGRDPGCGILHRFRLEPAPDFAPALLARNEVGVGEHRKVLGHRRQRHVKRRGERGDRASAARELRENRAPRRVGERGESAIKRTVFILNHMVRYVRPAAACQAHIAPRRPAPLDWKPSDQEARWDMDPLTAVATAAGLGWASGMRLYAVLFGLGVLQHAGIHELPADLQLLAHPAVMTVSGLLFFFEFFADKIPGVDSVWDAVHTFVRIPAGAVLAAAAVASADPALGLAAGLLGGVVAAGTHLTKAGGRALINASPEPFSNWIASLGEDFLSLLGLITAIKYPLLFLILLLIFFIAAAWLMPRLWRGVKRVFTTIRCLPGRRAPPS